MFIAKVLATIGLAALPTFLFGGDSSCKDSEYQAHLEVLDCPLVLAEFADFLTEAEAQLKRHDPSSSPNREGILAMLEVFSAEEIELRDCLVKHGDPDMPQLIRDIYASASIAVMALQAWIESPPGDERKKQWAMTKFDELVRTMRKYEHNNAFNADAANGCAG